MDNTDYRKKYLECFFMWQSIYALAEEHIRKLEEKIKELEKVIENDKLN